MIGNLPTRQIAVALAAVLAILTMLHSYWALGGRWGLAQAVGGPDNPIPPRWLIWSVALLLVAALLAVLGRAGFWGSRVPLRVFAAGSWGLALVLLSTAVINFLGETEWEVLVFGPAALWLSVAAAAVASAPRHGRHR
jgi:hypothetical protein